MALCSVDLGSDQEADAIGAGRCAKQRLLDGFSHECYFCNMSAGGYPLIGITTRGEDEAGRYALAARYVASVRRAGGCPVLLPPDEPEIEALLMRLSGVILSGGGDMDPALYGGMANDKIYSVDRRRDQTEIQMVKYAVSSGYPVLGICRGIQVMNVALGGALMEHLPDVVGEKIKHRLPEKEASFHSVTLHPDSRLAQIFGVTTFEVPSSHHQAISRLASPFTETAWAPDGIVEAVEIADHPFFIGVQWHPELSSDPLQQKLFDAFIQKRQKSMEGR